jgi:tight adherence protein B
MNADRWSAVAMAAAACAGALAGSAVAVRLLRLVHTRGTDARQVPVRVMSRIEAAVLPLRLAGSAGLIPTDRERLRLSLLFAIGGLGVGVVAAGVLAGVLLALAGGVAASRLIVTRRQRYGRSVDAGAGRAAHALADALAGGSSVRAAVPASVARLDGAIGVELDRAASDIALGLPTDEALDRLRVRSRSRRVDSIVAALRLQRRSGGELASLLRDVADAAEDAARLQDEARAATAQARFTAVLVTCFGPCAALLAELASPGTLGRIVESPSGLVLIVFAAVLQCAGSLTVSRISRITV